jgi:hypothetical protein
VAYAAFLLPDAVLLALIRLVIGMPEQLMEGAIRAPTSVRQIGADMNSQIKAWRMQPEELRTTADQFPGAVHPQLRAASGDP